MKRFSTLFMLLFVGLTIAKGQTTNLEERAIKATINALFKGMSTADTTLVMKGFCYEKHGAKHRQPNSFQLFKGDDGWKIIYIIDTRRKEGCN